MRSGYRSDPATKTGVSTVCHTLPVTIERENLPSSCFRLVGSRIRNREIDELINALSNRCAAPAPDFRETQCPHTPQDEFVETYYCCNPHFTFFATKLT